MDQIASGQASSRRGRVPRAFFGPVRASRSADVTDRLLASSPSDLHAEAVERHGVFAAGVQHLTRGSRCRLRRSGAAASWNTSIPGRPWRISMRTCSFRCNGVSQESPQSGRNSALYLNDQVRPVKRRPSSICEQENILRLQAIYGYWPVQADGDLVAGL